MTTTGARPKARTSARTAQERFEHRLSARRRRTWKVVGVLVVLAVLAAGGWWALWRSDWVLVEEVTVTGTEERWTSQVLAAAAVQKSLPLVEVDTAAIADAVREVPIVEAVEVSRSWPHTVSISVTPREPVLAVRQGSGTVAVVDGEGVVIETVSALPAGLPVVMTSGAAGATADAYQAASAVLAALPAAIAEQVTAATVSSADLVTLTLGERTVVWGGAEDAELKTRVAEALLRTGAAHIDVSAPRSPVTRGG